jgi:hypothetical protein
MKEPGLDDRHRDEDGEISLKHGNAQNQHLPEPIPEFPPETTVEEMRRITGETSIEKIRQAAKRL